MIEIFQIIFRVIVFIELGVFLHEFEVLLVKQYYQVKRFSKVVYNHYKYLIFILLFLDLLSIFLVDSIYYYLYHILSLSLLIVLFKYDHFSFSRRVVFQEVACVFILSIIWWFPHVLAFKIIFSYLSIILSFYLLLPLENRIKIYCYISVCGLLWSNWCEYKRTLGVEFGEYAIKQYWYAKHYYSIAMKEIKKIGHSSV